jgi:hypothetical protein
LQRRPCCCFGTRCDGGHLASYESFEEQYQTEKYFTDEGMLMPKFHKNYWMGLKSTEEDWPGFNRWALRCSSLLDERASEGLPATMKLQHRS